MFNLDEYNYDLPKDLIAREPLAKKDHSSLMVVGEIVTHHHFYDLVDMLKKDDVLVINTTKVVPYRLVGRKVTGSSVEINLLSPRNAKRTSWACHIKANHPKVGNSIHLGGGVRALIVNRKDDVFMIDCSLPLSASFLQKYGKLPFPSYLKRDFVSPAEYQTVYAKEAGSVAAPTAGLHFTPDLLRKLKKKGVTVAKVCLHVGFGTFLPVKDEMFLTKKMRPEIISVSKKSCDTINKRKGRLFVVGTTSLKSIETVADTKGMLHPFKGESELFIFPGYKFKVKPDALITNFHLPKSSLLLLVCAFAGKKRIFEAYAKAIKHGYRFYSFGDAMLLVR